MKIRWLILKPKYLKSGPKENLKKLVKIVGDFETESGGTESTNVWKQFRKAYPKKSKPIPTGVKNINGKVITNPEEKKDVTKTKFEHRMKERPRHKGNTENRRISGRKTETKN